MGFGLDPAFRPEGWRNAPAEPRERDTTGASGSGSRRTTHPTWRAWSNWRLKSTREPLGAVATVTVCVLVKPRAHEQKAAIGRPETRCMHLACARGERCAPHARA